VFPVVYKNFIFSNVRIIYTLAETQAGIHNGNLFAWYQFQISTPFGGVMRPGLSVLPLVLFFVILVIFAFDPSLVPLQELNA